MDRFAIASAGPVPNERPNAEAPARAGRAAPARGRRAGGFRAIAVGLAALAVALSPASAGAQDAEGGERAKRIASAVAGGFDWLLERQRTSGPEAGSWPGGRYPTAVTSIAGLALLAHGHLPGEDTAHGRAVERAMDYVEARMSSNGYLGKRASSMYVHAIATLFGLSYIGLSEEPEKEQELARWCRRAVELILEAQKVSKPPAEQGGWRYSPYSDASDLSVTSWQLLALHAARQCGYQIEQRVFDRALRYVNGAYKRVDEDAGGFLYRRGVSQEPEPGVTGAALGVKILLESDRGPRVPKALAFLDRFPPSWGGEQYKGYFYFVTFYMAQGYFQLGPQQWRAFGPAMEDVLLEHQAGDGHWPFPPDNRPQSEDAGPAYATAMSLLLLGMENQYLPMYQRQPALYR